MQVRPARALLNFLFGPFSKLFALAILPLAGLSIWRGNLSALGNGCHTTLLSRDASKAAGWCGARLGRIWGRRVCVLEGDGTGRLSIVLSSGGFTGATARFLSLSLVASSVCDIPST
jgi:hypothetical protein